jgi:hypothetical protein
MSQAIGRLKLFRCLASRGAVHERSPGDRIVTGRSWMIQFVDSTEQSNSKLDPSRVLGCEVDCILVLATEV